MYIQELYEYASIICGINLAILSATLQEFLTRKAPSPFSSGLLMTLPPLTKIDVQKQIADTQSITVLALLSAHSGPVLLILRIIIDCFEHARIPRHLLAGTASLPIFILVIVFSPSVGSEWILLEWLRVRTRCQGPLPLRTRNPLTIQHLLLR